MIPWLDRLVFKQFIMNKRHKYEIKIFKLCNEHGYTYAFSVYSGAKLKPEVGQAQRVCQELMIGLLEGRTLFVGNFYTSLPASQGKFYLENKTYAIGTLKANRRDLPKDAVTKKLKRSECEFRKNSVDISCHEMERRSRCSLTFDKLWA